MHLNGKDSALLRSPTTHKWWGVSKYAEAISHAKSAEKPILRHPLGAAQLVFQASATLARPRPAMETFLTFVPVST